MNNQFEMVKKNQSQHSMHHGRMCVCVFLVGFDSVVCFLFCMSVLKHWSRAPDHFESFQQIINKQIAANGLQSGSTFSQFVSHWKSIEWHNITLKLLWWMQEIVACIFASACQIPSKFDHWLKENRISRIIAFDCVCPFQCNSNAFSAIVSQMCVVRACKMLSRLLFVGNAVLFVCLGFSCLCIQSLMHFGFTIYWMEALRSREKWPLCIGIHSSIAFFRVSIHSAYASFFHGNLWPTFRNRTKTERKKKFITKMSFQRRYLFLYFHALRLNCIERLATVDVKWLNQPIILQLFFGLCVCNPRLIL